MKTTIIKWDESMAVRCLARYGNNDVKAVYIPPEVKNSKVLKIKASQNKDFSADLAAGEWDGFEYAINNALKKKYK